MLRLGNWGVGVMGSGQQIKKIKKKVEKKRNVTHNI